jgi:hypothetical protein
MRDLAVLLLHLPSSQHLTEAPGDVTALAAVATVGAATVNFQHDRRSGARGWIEGRRALRSAIALKDQQD